MNEVMDFLPVLHTAISLISVLLLYEITLRIRDIAPPPNEKDGPKVY